MEIPSKEKIRKIADEVNEGRCSCPDAANELGGNPSVRLRVGCAFLKFKFGWRSWYDTVKEIEGVYESADSSPMKSLEQSFAEDLELALSELNAAQRKIKRLQGELRNLKEG